ncbi:MAG: sigma-54 dependent transcriptional regulator [Nitrospirota bacterium]
MRVLPRILIVDDDELIVTTITRSLQREGYDVRSENSALRVVEAIRSWSPCVVLLDIRLPERSGIEVLEDIVRNELRTQVIMLTADDTAETAVKAMKLGAADYMTKPFNLDEIIIVVRNHVAKENLSREVDYLRKVAGERFDRQMIGKSDALTELRAELDKIARAHVSSVLITGESGTGKELVARYLHQVMFGEASSRTVPFIGVNCAALPENLLESELFGHERGAFTDAKSDKKGVFELANGGVILLDEIGEMDPRLQAKLLRVLEERVVHRVGGREDIPVDVTVIATTNKNLAKAGSRGEFRTDLFFRLSNFYVHVPPLRERRVDIPILADYFLSLFATRYNNKFMKRFSPDALHILSEYDWPGNIRELRNVVERFVVLESEEEIVPSMLPEWMLRQKVAAGGSGYNGEFTLPEKGVSIDDLERNLLQQALERTNHNKAQAAKLLHLSYDTLRYQVKKHGLE